MSTNPIDPVVRALEQAIAEAAFRTHDDEWQPTTDPETGNMSRLLGKGLTLDGKPVRLTTTLYRSPGHYRADVVLTCEGCGATETFGPVPPSEIWDRAGETRPLIVDAIVRHVADGTWESKGAML